MDEAACLLAPSSLLDDEHQINTYVQLTLNSPHPPLVGRGTIGHALGLQCAEKNRHCIFTKPWCFSNLNLLLATNGVIQAVDR